MDGITLCLIERQQLSSSSSTKTHEKVIYQSKVIPAHPHHTHLPDSFATFHLRHSSSIFILIFKINPVSLLICQTPANEASSVVAAKSHALFEYIIRPPKGSFSILAGKSLQISYFVELRADIALSTGLVHRFPGSLLHASWCMSRRLISVFMFAASCISPQAVMLADNSTGKEPPTPPQALLAASSASPAHPQPE